jgi:hypothetical protein
MIHPIDLISLLNAPTKPGDHYTMGKKRNHEERMKKE